MYYLISIISATVLVAAVETEQANFFKNGGFEESSLSTELQNWRPWAMFNEPIDPAKASITVDKTVSRSGKCSLKIEAKDDKGYGCEQTLDADALCRKSGLNKLDGVTLKLTGYIKDKGAHLAIDFVGETASCQASEPGDTTNDWTQHTIEWVLPKGTRTFHLLKHQPLLTFPVMSTWRDGLKRPGINIRFLAGLQSSKKRRICWGRGSFLFISMIRLGK